MTQPVQKSFQKKFMQLASGSALAQAASLLLMPLLSRLYSPTDFGTFAVYYAISTVLGLISTLRFDVAIILCKDDSEAAQLVWLNLTITAVFTFIAAGFLALGAWLKLTTYLTLELLPAAILSTLAIGMIQTLLNWHSRRQAFQVLGFRNVAERVLTLGMGILFATLSWHSAGLMYAQTLGLGLSALYLFYQANRHLDTHAPTVWPQLIRRYSDFPLRHLPSTILSAGAGQIVALLFARFFTREQLGQYNLASRILEAPITLIANTFSTVYYQTVAQRVVAERRRLFFRSLRGLGLAFSVPILALALAGPFLFSWIFGDNWALAGGLAQILGVLTLFRLFFVSQSSLLLVQRKLNIDLWLSALLFASQIGGFALGYGLFGTIYSCILFISALGAMVYIFGLYKIFTILQEAQ